jgi:hypothetical protein
MALSKTGYVAAMLYVLCLMFVREEDENMEHNVKNVWFLDRFWSRNVLIFEWNRPLHYKSRSGHLYCSPCHEDVYCYIDRYCFWLCNSVWKTVCHFYLHLIAIFKTTFNHIFMHACWTWQYLSLTLAYTKVNCGNWAGTVVAYRRWCHSEFCNCALKWNERNLCRPNIVNP